MGAQTRTRRTGLLLASIVPVLLSAFACVPRAPETAAPSVSDDGGRNSSNPIDGGVDSQSRPDAGNISPDSSPITCTQLSSGDLQSCCIGSDGSVKCWGVPVRANEEDTIHWRFLPTRSRQRAEPIAALGTDNAEVAVGLDHVCLRKTNGAVKCLGSNVWGQLGDGTTQSTLVPVDVQGLFAPTIQVVARTKYSCALTTTGAVWCWGFTFGRTPRLIDGLHQQVTSLWGGKTFICGIRSDGAVLCAGSNNTGQLGRTTPGDSTEIAQPVVGLPGATLKVAAGSFHACALIGGDVYCWGWNSSQNFGSDVAFGVHRQAMKVNALSGDVVDLNVGGAPWERDDSVTPAQTRTCALKRNGTILCVGSTAYGQIGALSFGGTGESPEPVHPWRNQPVALSGTGAFTCALDTVGHVGCWGLGLWGALGNSHESRQRIVLNGPAAHLAAKGNYVCAVLIDGTIDCWGGHTLPVGELDAETQFPDLAPRQLKLKDGSATAVTIQANTACAASTSGSVWCWGSSFSGWKQIEPIQSPVLQLTSGDAHSCAMLENGQTWCWGSNANGQLGQPKDMPTEGTFQISVPDGGIQQLVATNSMSCVRRGTGDVWCWGDARCGFEHPESLRGTYDDIVFELNDALCLRNRTGTLECAFDGPRGVGKPIPGKSCDGRWREIKLPTVNVPSLVAGTSAFVCTSEGDALVMCRRESPFPTGNDLEESYTFPQPVEQLVMLEEALCARLQNGDVWCMGKNGTGTLGVGDAVSSRPLEVQR